MQLPMDVTRKNTVSIGLQGKMLLPKYVTGKNVVTNGCYKEENENQWILLG